MGPNHRADNMNGAEKVPGSLAGTSGDAAILFEPGEEILNPMARLVHVSVVLAPIDSLVAAGSRWLGLLFSVPFCP